MTTTDTGSAHGLLFEDALFGYDRSQVDAYVTAAVTRQHQLAAEVQRLSTVERELIAARAEIARLTDELSAAEPHATIGPRLQRILRLAHEEAREVRVQAAEELRRARLDAQLTRASATRAAQEARRDFELALHERRRRYQAAVDEIISGARRQAARIIDKGRRTVTVRVSNQ